MLKNKIRAFLMGRWRAFLSSSHERMRVQWEANLHQPNPDSRYNANAWSNSCIFIHVYSILVSVRLLAYGVITEAGLTSPGTYFHYDPECAWIFINFGFVPKLALFLVFHLVAVLKISYCIMIRQLPGCIQRPLHELLLRAQSEPSQSQPTIWIQTVDRMERRINFLLVAGLFTFSCICQYAMIDLILHSGVSVFLIFIKVVLVSIECPVFILIFFLSILRLYLFCWAIGGLWHCLAVCEMTRMRSRLQHCLLASNIKVCRLMTELAHFRRSHASISVQLVQLNRRIVSPILFIVLWSFVPINVYLVVGLYFHSLKLFAQVFALCVVGAEIGALLHAVGYLLYTQDIVYSPARLLGFPAQTRLNNRVYLRAKLKLMSHYEFLHTRQRSPCCFTIGHMSQLTRHWAIEFFLFYSSMIMFTFTVFIGNKPSTETFIIS